MNKTVTIALASLLAVSPVAGVAYAQDAMSTGSIAADNVNVVQISTLDDADSNSIEFERLNTLSKDPTALEKAQADLQSDPALVQALASKNVELMNVVEVQTAADGGKIVYVK